MSQNQISGSCLNWLKDLVFMMNIPKGYEDQREQKEFTWPEDATDEIARIIKTIGLTGWTAKRIKRSSSRTGICLTRSQVAGMVR